MGKPPSPAPPRPTTGSRVTAPKQDGRGGSADPQGVPDPLFTALSGTDEPVGDAASRAVCKCLLAIPLATRSLSTLVKPRFDLSESAAARQMGGAWLWPESPRQSSALTVLGH